MAGAPNTFYALQTLSEEMRKVKIKRGKSLTRMEVGSVFIPLGTTNGTSNAVNFGVGLMAFRDKDLNLAPNRMLPMMNHHDLDAPALWNLSEKEFLYFDGFREIRASRADAVSVDDGEWAGGAAGVGR